MSWQKYHLHFRLLSPLHIGWRKTGNLMQTRGYVPARNLWAALTARLTRDFDNGSNAQRYQEIGELVKKHFRFTYFYPALKNGDNYTPHYPWQKNFDYLFLGSYAATALNYQAQAAEEAMLRETEFIAPQTRDNQKVYLSGCIYVQNAPLPAPLNNWQKALAQLQIGGEQGYGWGRLKNESCSPCGEPIETDDPPAELVKERLAAHLIATETTRIVGEIEPLAGWERNNSGAGNPWRLRQEIPICYAPGSTRKDNTQTFVIGEEGYWQR